MIPARRSRRISFFFSSCHWIFFALLGVAACQHSPAPKAADDLPSTPWSDQVIYFLVVDRFANGDSTNDRQTPNGIEAGGTADHYNGGDFAGLRQRIDYIRGLGATAIWITPPVKNQWWDGRNQQAGYHGYWGSDLKEVDPHWGTKQEYRDLVGEAHARGMSVIQDIVPNHLGSFFIYENGQYRLNDKSIPPNRPEQWPFSQNDFTDSAQRAMNIYHWPSEVTADDRLRMQFGGTLNDLNTENPVVIAALKNSYGSWISDVGVDAFRVDTAIYAPHEFWREFLRGPDGIAETAAQHRRPNFFTFGEAWILAAPYSDEAEVEIARYAADGFQGMLDFPLYMDITRVFKEGQPTDYLGYRIDARQRIYEQPSRMVTFIDNHDTARFLHGATPDDLELALTFLFVNPGMPAILYGTEQGLTEPRAALFAGGHAADGDRYQPSAMYQFIARLAALRRGERAFREGRVTPILVEPAGSGILALQITWQNTRYLVIFNTDREPTYATNLALDVADGTPLKNLLAMRNDATGLVYRRGLSMHVPGKSVAIWRAETTPTHLTPQPAQIATPPMQISLTDNFSEPIVADRPWKVRGTVSGAARVDVWIDGRPIPGGSIQVNSSSAQSWRTTLDISGLVAGRHRFVAMATDSAGSVVFSENRIFTVQEYVKRLVAQKDAVGDDRGPQGSYAYPSDASFNRPGDITNVRVTKTNGALLLDITMKELSTIWHAPNGFDHVLFQIFFDDPKRTGTTVLPLINATMPRRKEWDTHLFVGGWTSKAFAAMGASADQWGESITPVPQVVTDVAARRVQIRVPCKVLQSERCDVRGWTLYLTTYDYDAISGHLRPMDPAGGAWTFKGARDAPKILDDLAITLP